MSGVSGLVLPIKQACEVVTADGYRFTFQKKNLIKHFFEKRYFSNQWFMIIIKVNKLISKPNLTVKAHGDSL